MRKVIQQFGLIAFLMNAISIGAIGQQLDYGATKEKVYIQTSHVFFKQGETLFFKIYVVNAKNQAPATVSNTVYVEVINPAGNVLQKLTYKVTDGYAEGSYDFEEAAVGGIYKLRAYTTWMRNENESAFFVKEITLQKVIAPRVLLKLDFPEKGYGAGSAVGADFSMRNLANEPIRYYGGKFTVSIGGQPVQMDKFKTDNEGKAKIRFSLPAGLKTNDGLLNVTIDYDSYTEAISRSIPIVLNRIDLQFMPEGGTFVEGIATHVAFKALNEDGKAADVKGEIWDSKGNKVTTFESYHFGMGQFLFTPVKGESYEARIISPANISQQFELPVATQTGVVMNFEKSNNVVRVRLTSADKRQVRLIGQTKNRFFYTKDLWLEKGMNTIEEINERNFPVGIAQFTLFDPGNLPLAERLVFLNEDKNLQVTITTDKKKYLPREKVTMTIKTVDENGKPVPSDFSLTVMDDKLWSFADDKQDHILSWLLMSSELKGKVEEPQFYFKKDEPKAIPALDLVMLTNGYRYFDYIEYVKDGGRLKFTPDQDNMLSGVVSDSKGKPVKAKVFLASTVAGGKGMQVETDEQGNFFFSHLAYNANYYVIAQSLSRKKYISINIVQNGIGYNPQNTSQLKQIKSPDSEFAVNVAPANPAYRQVALQKPMAEKQPLGANHWANLQEVVVTGYGAQKKKDMTGAIATVAAKDIAGFADVALALEGRVAGIEVFGNANPLPDQKIRIRGHRSLLDMGQPLFVINGVPVEQADFSSLNPNDIESITIWKDAAAIALYGSKAANGVVVIESKKLRGERIRFDLSNSFSYASQFIKSNGSAYTVARRFYSPKYATVVTEERTDLRETIYWNPVVQTGMDGEAVVEFYNSDASTTFRAIAEGIGWNGKLGRGEATYAVQNAMSVDAKIPPYLTVGDKALLPLVIKNNKETDMEISVEVTTLGKFIIGDYTKNIIVPANNSGRVLIPFEATSATKGTIYFTITNQFGRERISLPVSASDKGFPVIATISGNRDHRDSVIVSKLVPGTLKAELKVYKGIEGQLMDGIESMLQEPYGCFEQTSSTTYPNIFVLKYLREAGKSNPDIEKKALGYIERGYKALISFETPNNGFEWFGRTPPHEALTAYGLLEFTDMGEFIKVDKQMIERTKNFLLQRRDGKGQFKLATGGLDQFRAVPDKIANIYIVYALTQAGIGREIQLEYQTAVKKALESNDGYQLAMMALAASNMKNEKDYRQLMNALNDLFRDKDLRAETSIVNSRDASLRVETVSLYAMALMRNSSPDFGRISNLVTKIVSSKSYYGYGSTQGTVLALNAIVEYSKLMGKITEDTPIEFALNDKIVKDGGTAEAVLREGKNDFAVNYLAKDKAVPYSLQVAYSTFTPPNSEKAELHLATQLKTDKAQVGETVRMEIEVTNQKAELQPMAIAKIGIPAGLSVQPWQLKEIMEKNKAAYYEIFDNYLVFYWMGFRANETKKISLDLKADVPGHYKAKASNVYLYYTPEYKNWNDGGEVEIVDSP